MQLEGKVAIVTGAARGIGYAIAKRFLMDGASVVLSDVDGAGATKAVRDLEQYGRVLAIACDVGDKLDIHNLLTYATTNLGEIDILVNNAGIVHQAEFLDLTSDTARAAAFAQKCGRREEDDRLVMKPGTDRGVY